MRTIVENLPLRATLYSCNKTPENLSPSPDQTLESLSRSPDHPRPRKNPPAFLHPYEWSLGNIVMLGRPLSWCCLHRGILGPPWDSFYPPRWGPQGILAQDLQVPSQNIYGREWPRHPRAWLQGKSLKAYKSRSSFWRSAPDNFPCRLALWPHPNRACTLSGGMADGSGWQAGHSVARTVCSNPAMCNHQWSSAQFALRGSTVHPPSNGTGADPGSYPAFGNYQTGDLMKNF